MGPYPPKQTATAIRRKRILLILACVAFVSGCSATNPQVRTTTGPDAALVYGFFDLSESPHRLKSVRITQGERAGIAYRQSDMTTFPDGLFFIENVPPMKYHIPWFMAGGVMHSFGGDKGDIFEVPAGGLVFVGSFKYHDPKKGGIVTSKKFDMRPVRSPGEAGVLGKLLPHVKDPRWKKKIQARLKQLKAKK